MLNRLLTTTALIIGLGAFAFAQGGPGGGGDGPGPTPSPWDVDGPTISYSQGGLAIPAGVTGGGKGVGTINVSVGYYINNIGPTGSGGIVLSTSPTITTPTINNPTISGGTFSGLTLLSPTITTPAISGGTQTSPAITTPTITTPAISGGTQTSPTITTPKILQTTRLIASGTTDTLSATDFEVLWNSSSTSAKAQAVPACAGGNAGKEYVISDKANSAATAHITLTPASGTIGGLSTQVMMINRQSLTIQCDGNSDWTLE